MSRRKRLSPAEQFIDDTWQILLTTPWWTCLVIAPIFYALFAYLIPAVLSGSDITRLCIPASRQIAAPFTAAGVLAMGVAAQFVKLFRSRLAYRPARRDTLDSMTWREFEHLVGAIYSKQGYRVVQIGGVGSDGGVDLVLHGNGEKVLVQCKQWRNYRVGVRDLREFHGVLRSRSTTANRGIFATMGSFTGEALSFAEENGIELADGGRLLRMMEAVQSAPAYPSESAISSEVPAIEDQGGQSVEAAPPSCPVCGKAMALRTARKGQYSGSQFWGCTGYPDCKGKRQL